MDSPAVHIGQALIAAEKSTIPGTLQATGVANELTGAAHSSEAGKASAESTAASGRVSALAT